MILELRHKSLHVRRDTTDRALSVQSKLSGWANDVHEFAMADETDDEGEGGANDRNTARNGGGIAPLFATLMSVLEHESTIALNRPLLAKKPATSASQAALQACIHASRTILETLDDRQLFQPASAYGDTSRLSRTPHVGRLAATPQAQTTATDSTMMSADTTSNTALMSQNPDFPVDMNDQDWLFDPLSALDFSNFAQAGSAESSMGFSFY
ncbi:hypothetical protein N0V82_001246 [Gnomoniopsis sp. IMI 355080]|nr:hypothetical protein N0V82_001246 [Gnomoniopsis sp. IMI 355080]